MTVLCHDIVEITLTRSSPESNRREREMVRLLITKYHDNGVPNNSINNYQMSFEKWKPITEECLEFSYFDNATMILYSLQVCKELSNVLNGDFKLVHCEQSRFFSLDY